MLPKLILFDIDLTLTRSKQPVTSGMAELLSSLAARAKLGLISGGTFEQLLTQVVEHLPVPTELPNIYILPTSGGALYAHENHAWACVYEETLPAESVARIEAAFKEAVAETGLVDLSEPSYGPRIERRGAQVTFSALGQEAPIDQKQAWDPDGRKRDALRAAVAARLPDFDVKRGGSTSLDVTLHGVNKAYGVRKLSAHTGIAISDMLYVGDALMAGGNDAVVKETGIPTHEVKDPDDTAAFIRTLLA